MPQRTRCLLRTHGSCLLCKGLYLLPLHNDKSTSLLYHRHHYLIASRISAVSFRQSIAEHSSSGSLISYCYPFGLSDTSSVSLFHPILVYA